MEAVKYKWTPFWLAVCWLTGLAAQPMESDSIAMFGLINDVVVTAQYAPTDSRNSVYRVQTITREVIEQRGAANLEQLLSQELSIRIQQDLVLGSSMSLLGVEGENVKIMIDGVPVIGRLDGNIDLSQLNLHDIERVEIIEGPMSVSYGTDALGGVINLITRRSQLETVTVAAQQQLETQAEQTTNLSVGWRPHERWLLQAQGGRDYFGGVGGGDARTSLWNPKEQWYGNASVRWNGGGEQTWRYRFAAFDETVTNLGSVRRPQFRPYAFDDFYYTRRLDHALTHEGPVGRHYYWQTVVGYNDFRRQKNSFRTDFEGGDPALVPGQQDTARFAAVTLRSVIASRRDSFPINFQLGLDLRHENSRGERIANPESGMPGFSELGDYALFGSLRYRPLPALTAELGLRAAYNTRYQAPLVPAFHLSYRPAEQWTLRASYARGFRSPSLKELFFEFIDINHFIVGNPELRAERSENIQLSASFRPPAGRPGPEFQLLLFRNHITDKIDLFEFVETGAGMAPALGDTGTLRFAYFNQAVFKTQGLNLRGGYCWKNLDLKGGFSLIGYYQPLSESDLGLSPFTYAMEWSGEAAYRWPTTGLRLSLFVRANDRLITYFPSQDPETGTSVAGQRVQEGFTLLDWTLTKNLWRERLQLTGGVRNLLDVQRAAAAGGGGAHSGSAGSVPVSPGRSFFLRLALQLGWGT